MSLSFLQHFRLFIARIKTMMNLDYLPDPSSEGPGTQALFPASQSNPKRLKEGLTLGVPFITYTSLQIRNDLEVAGEHCAHFRIVEVRYYQRTTGPLHEYIVVIYEDVVRREEGIVCRNYAVIERWASSYIARGEKRVDEGTLFENIVKKGQNGQNGPPDGLNEDSNDETQNSKRPGFFSRSSKRTSAEGMGTKEGKESDSESSSGLSAPPPGLNDPDPSTSKSQLSKTLVYASAQSAQSSSKTKYAWDRFSVSYRRNLDDVALLEPGESTLLATLTPPPDSTFSIAHLAVLARCVSERIPNYILGQDQCYYYGRVIYDTMKTAMGKGAQDIREGKSVPGNFFCDTMKELVRERVQKEHDGSAFKRYNQAWTEFEASVAEAKERRERPWKEAVARGEEADARAEREREAKEREHKAREEAEARAERDRKAREEADARAERDRKAREEAEAREKNERKARKELEARLAALEAGALPSKAAGTSTASSA